MLLADQALFVAGPKGDWTGAADVSARHNSVALTAVSAADGKAIVEHSLPASSVFEGISAVGGLLHISLENGPVVCYGRVPLL